MKSVDGFYDAGRDSGEGYISGLWSKAREMADAAADVVRNALRAAKDAIDSNSPSKKYMELGEDSDRGYILGVENKADQVNNAMSTLATNAMAAFHEAISRADMAANSDLVITPTVTPIVDMDGVYGTIDYLDGIFNGTTGALGTIKADINGNVEDINRLAVTTNRILSVLQRARPITIDGTTVIGWIDRELGALE
jgi:ABC-type transporter Mla subunit MlaD